MLCYLVSEGLSRLVKCLVIMLYSYLLVDPTFNLGTLNPEMQHDICFHIFIYGDWAISKLFAFLISMRWTSQHLQSAIVQTGSGIHSTQITSVSYSL